MHLSTSGFFITKKILFISTLTGFVIYLFRIIPHVLALLYGNSSLTFKLRSYFCHFLYFDLPIAQFLYAVSFIICTYKSSVTNQISCKLYMLFRVKYVLLIYLLSKDQKQVFSTLSNPCDGLFFFQKYSRWNRMDYGRLSSYCSTS